MKITWKCGHTQELWGADRRKAEKNCKWMVCKDCYSNRNKVENAKSNEEIEAAAAMSEIQAY